MATAPQEAGPKRVHTYQVVIEFPNNSADPDVTQDVGSTVPDLTVTGASDVDGGGGDGDGASSAGAAATGLGGATVTESLGWASTISYGKTFAFELRDLRALKRACAHGCRFEVYETMVEYVRLLRHSSLLTSSFRMSRRHATPPRRAV